MEENNKVVLLKDLIGIVQSDSFSEYIDNCHFTFMLMKEIFSQLKNNDEIIFGDLSDDFYSIKRTPTISEMNDSFDNKEAIFSQYELENNFKAYFTMRNNQDVSK